MKTSLIKLKRRFEQTGNESVSSKVELKATFKRQPTEGSEENSHLRPKKISL